MARDVPLVVRGIISDTDPYCTAGHFLLPRAERGRLPAPPSPPCNVRPIRHGEPQVEFKGWPPVAPDLWKVWVDKLRARHEDLWRDAGILDAILATTTSWVGRDEGALLQLAAFWSADTNTFVFPWGEATVTLEDVAVLAGLPMSGEPVCKKFYGSARGDVDALEDVRSYLCRSSWNAKPSHAAWANHFSGLPPEGEFEVLEHEGFLAMWLSLFVIPAPPSDEVGVEVLPAAARLARGGTVALAPAALSSIYADLSALRRHVDSSGERQPFAAWAPLHILQMWVWERFPELRPEEAAASASTPPRDVPRAARRWPDVHKVFDPRYVHAVLMSPAKFEWMPYRSSGIAPPHGSYGRKDIVERPELLVFAHCLRACELVGMNTIEQYRPHRVARQLGYDQDVPGAVARVNSSQFAAWATYKIGVVKFSFAVPIYAPAVTDEYEQWWEPCSRACASAVAEAARMKVSIPTQVAGDDVNGMMPGWVQNAAKRATSRKRKKCSQGPSAAEEPIASVAEKERPKSLQKQSQEDASQPVTIPDEQNTISEQAQVLMVHHPAKQTQFGATSSSLLKPSEERQPARTGNSAQGNIVFRKGEKFSQGSSGAAAILMAAVDEPSASVAEKERSKSLQQRSQEDAPQPVATPDEQNTNSEQAQVLMTRHPAKETQFGATTSSLPKPSEERQLASTGNSDQGNICFGKGEKFSQGSSGAAAILMAEVDEPSASVAEKERSKSLQQQSQEDVPQPVATPDEQNTNSEQAQVLMTHHPAKETQFGATTSSLLKPSEERQPASTGNSDQGNICFGKGKKFSQGSSGAAAILVTAVDEHSASVAEKERSKSLQQQSQEDAPQPVAMPDEQNTISEQAQVLRAHHPAKETQFGATTSSLLKPSEERQPASTGNSDQGNTVFWKGKKFSQGSSGAAAILVTAVDEPSASVAEKERSKSLQQQSQEDVSQPVTISDEHNTISEQAQVLMAHHPAKQTQLGATSEERRPVSTGNNEPAAALEDLTLQQQPADGVAAVRTNAGPLPGPTEETRTGAVTVEMGNGEMSSSDPVSEVDRVRKYCATALAAALKNITLQQEPADPRAVTVEMANGEMSSSNPILEHLRRISELDAALKNITLQQETNNNVSSPNQQMECAEANENSSGNGENVAPDSTEVCTKTLYYLSRSDRSEEAWANDANRNADFFQPKRAVGTMEMIAKASAIRQAEIAALEKTIMELKEEI